LSQEIIAKLAKILPNDTSIYHHMQQYHHQYYHIYHINAIQSFNVNFFTFLTTVFHV